MLQRIAKLWRALRDRVARQHAAARQSPQAETVRVLEQWLDCSRDDVRREQAELVRERAENDRLRAEIERLKLDNRALLNSLLGTAGIPPLEAPRTGADAPAVRRPSWPQIAAKREAAAARAAAAERRRQDAKP